MFTECDEPEDLPTSGYAKDAVEIEGYIRGFVRRREDVDVTVLRFTSFIGPRIDTALTRYFALPVMPTVLGFDARMQLLHEEDVLAVFERATRERLPGVFNVGGDGVLLLSQAIRRAGRIPAPIPEPAVARLLGVPYFPMTPFFPLLGPLGAIPLPSKWYIEFGEPIPTDAYEPGSADDPMLVFTLADQVRETIQQILYRLLAQRRNTFLG
jgi:hypothetical protein